MREQPALCTRWPDRGVAGRRGVKRRQAMREQRTGVAIGIGITLLLMGLYPLGVFEWLELRSYDLRYALLPSHPLDTPIRLVRIDEESETSLGVRAPDVPRAMYADAVKQLVRAGAALIAFDIIFSIREIRLKTRSSGKPSRRPAMWCWPVISAKKATRPRSPCCARGSWERR